MLHKKSILKELTVATTTMQQATKSIHRDETIQ